VLVGGLITLPLLTLYITPDCHVHLDKTPGSQGACSDARRESLL